MSRYQPAPIHLALGTAFYDAVRAAEFPKSILRYRNDAAASAIGLDSLSDADFIRHFARFVPLADNLPEPLALRYHGHQFGVYNPDIGDGRGFLFAQCRQEATGRILDLGTKGSGRTPYARTADGRLTLKGAVREILATEMLTALNVPTSQTFCVIETGESLNRQDEPSPTRSAVLTRMLHSHIRIGSFQRLAYLRQQENLEILLRHTIKYYYPDLDSEADLKELIPGFLGKLAAKIARMVAGWMAAGFVHGVLNTDNFNITGESFDYGPWRFLPAMQPGFTAAYFDQQKRYAYGRQPEAALWALCRLADCFQTILDAEALGSALGDYWSEVETQIARAICWRLGVEAKDKTAKAISQQLFLAAGQSGIGWDQLFKDAYGGQLAPDEATSALWQQDRGLAELAEQLATLQTRQKTPEAIAQIKAAPLVTMEISVMEGVWAPIAEADDWQPFDKMLAQIRAHGAALKQP